MNKYKSFQEFWPIYVAEHSNDSNRYLHVCGTLTAVALFIFFVLTKNYRSLIFVPLSGYSFAWVGHFFIEKNQPATFEAPVYSLIADFKMAILTLSGKWVN